ncbi:Uncharacterised protein [Acinetobacter baumannii]|nr:Uncharacterised protein [Acinetobacter baumannii]
MFNVVLAFEDKPFWILPPSNANSVFPEASVTTKLIAKFARAGGKLRSPASAVNFSTVANQSSVKNAGMILPQIYLFNFSSVAYPDNIV